jgi:Acetyltransferase (GNAT) domain
MAIRTLDTDQSHQWDAALKQTRHDFYYGVDYHRLAEERGEGLARLYVFEQNGYTIVMPLLLRPVQSVYGLADSGADYWDATSVYGYGGPACSHVETPQDVVRTFQEELATTLAESQVVAAFSRMHPLYPGQAAILGGLGEYLLRWQTVSIDLTCALDDQIALYRQSHRREIRLLRRDGFEVVLDHDGRYLDAFVEIYTETMRRLAAPSSYYFERRYFDRLMSNRQVFQLFVAIWQGQVVSGALFGLCDGVCQYHLSGTHECARRQAPTKLILDEARIWAYNQGAHVLHLGGGQGKEDSLFQFKAGFSDRRHDFAIWRWVVRPDVYAQLVDARDQAERQQGRQLGGADFFPRYRGAAVALTYQGSDHDI